MLEAARAILSDLDRDEQICQLLAKEALPKCAFGSKARGAGGGAGGRTSWKIVSTYEPKECSLIHL
eukprot:4978787-Pyramimonas_sp.AAC.2